MTAKWLVAIITGLTVAVLALAWITFAPTSFGGRTTYLLTAGRSMQPGISEGDLVLLREDSSYAVGDVVAYRVDDRIILHRVVAVDGERFVLQGDNNPFPDPFLPAEDDIQGKLWLRVPAPSNWDVPASGFWIIIGVAILGGFIVMIPASSRATAAAREVVTSLDGRGLNLGGGERFAPLLGSTGHVLSVVVAVLGLTSLALALVAFSQPAERLAVTEVPFTQQATFEYSADAPGSVYDEGVLETGDPIYRDVIDQVEFTVRYMLDSSGASGITGTYRLDAVVHNQDGWSSVIPLVESTSFDGPWGDIAARLDLSEVDARIAAFEDQIAAREAAYSLSIVPAISVGDLNGDGQAQEMFAPRLEFVVDDAVLRLAEPTAPIGAEIREGIQQIETGTAVRREPVTNSFNVLGGDVEVDTARQVSVAGLALSVVAGLALILMVRRAMQAPEPVQIAARYGSKVVDLRGANLKANGRLVEVAGFEDLLKVAGQGGRHVLHFQRDGRHFYFVHTADVIFGYRTDSTPRLPHSSQSDDASRSLPHGK